jgi:hypothetical protein
MLVADLVRTPGGNTHPPPIIWRRNTALTVIATDLGSAQRKTGTELSAGGFRDGRIVPIHAEGARTCVMRGFLRRRGMHRFLPLYGLDREYLGKHLLRWSSRVCGF